MHMKGITYINHSSPDGWLKTRWAVCRVGSVSNITQDCKLDQIFYRRQVPDEILENLYCNLCWLDGRIEWHLMANHLFANAKALVFGGLFIDGLSANKILRHGLEILDQQIDEQILQDGGHFERSPMYHSIILEDILDLIAVSAAYGLPEVDRHVEKWSMVASKMLGWLEALTHPDGCLAHFNDVAQHHAPSASHLVKYAANLGISSASAGQKQGQLTELSSTGFIRAKTERLDVMMNVGSVGPAYQPGHAHADTLSFELSVDGQRWFVNTGVSGYGVTADRSYERSSEAHNTVVVDGMDPLRFGAVSVSPGGPESGNWKPKHQEAVYLFMRHMTGIRGCAADQSMNEAGWWPLIG